MNTVFSIQDVLINKRNTCILNPVEKFGRQANRHSSQKQLSACPSSKIYNASVENGLLISPEMTKWNKT